MAKISPDLEREILKKAAAGATTREISSWCAEVHKVSVTFGAIAKMLRKTRETRTDVAAAITREALRPHVVSDLERLEEIRREAAERRKDAIKGKGCAHLDYVRLAQLEVEIIDKKLKLAGAGAGEDGPRGGVVLLPPMEGE